MVAAGAEPEGARRAFRERGNMRVLVNKSAVERDGVRHFLDGVLPRRPEQPFGCVQRPRTAEPSRFGRLTRFYAVAVGALASSYIRVSQSHIRIGDYLSSAAVRAFTYAPALAGLTVRVGPRRANPVSRSRAAPVSRSYRPLRGSQPGPWFGQSWCTRSSGRRSGEQRLRSLLAALLLPISRSCEAVHADV
jgi:hypothetical protein